MFTGEVDEAVSECGLDEYAHDITVVNDANGGDVLEEGIQRLAKLCV